MVHWVLAAGRWALAADTQRATAARDGSPRAIAGDRLVLERHVESRHVAPCATTATERALDGQRRGRRRLRRRVRRRLRRRVRRLVRRRVRRKVRRAPGMSCHVVRAALCTHDTCTCRAAPIPSANLGREPSRAPADGRGRRPRGTISSTRRIGGVRRRRRTRGTARGTRRRRRLRRVSSASFGRRGPLRARFGRPRTGAKGTGHMAGGRAPASSSLSSICCARVEWRSSHRQPSPRGTCRTRRAFRRRKVGATCQIRKVRTSHAIGVVCS